MNRAIFVLLLCGGLLFACEERTSVPPEVLEQAQKTQQQADAKSKVPTTQELLTGPRSRTALIPLPLTMDLPPGWGRFEDVNQAGLKLPNLLQGYTPSGAVEIELRPRPAMKKEDLERMVEGGRKEMQEKPQQILKFELRDLSQMKILERQSVGEPRPLTTYDAQNQPHTTTESPFNWVVSALVPSGDAYQVYELSFLGLTKSQYDKDKEFLNDILGTLRYAGDGAPPPTTAPAAASGPV